MGFVLTLVRLCEYKRSYTEINIHDQTQSISGVSPTLIPYKHCLGAAP